MLAPYLTRAQVWNQSMEKRVGHVVYVFEIFLNVLPVVVAMSGGVDSSVTAALLAQDVRLIKFQLLTLTG